VPATVRASFRVEDPPDEPDAPLTLKTSLAEGRHRASEIVRLSVVVHDRGGDGQASPVARVGIPAGLSVPVWQIDDLVDQQRVAALEVGEGEVVLYWDGIDPGATLEVPLDLTAEFPGTTTGAPSSVGPYYASGSRAWSAPLTIEILGVQGSASQP